MTPQEAKARYEAEWPALNAAKEAAISPHEQKKCRQELSALSKRYAARFELVPTAQTNTEKVQVLGWYDGDQLFHLREGVEPKWPSRRVPDEDKIIEVML